RGAGSAVIGLVQARGADCQRVNGNIGQCRGAGRSQLIVGGIQTAEAQAGGGDSLGGADRFGGEAGGAAAQADIVAGQRAAQGAGGDGGSRGAVVNLVVRRDAGGHRRFGYVKRSAHCAGQAAGDAGRQLLGRAGGADLEAGKAHHAVAGRSADVERGGALEQAGSGTEGEGHHFRGAYANSGIITKRIAALDHGLGAEGRTVNGRAGLGGKDQPVGCSRTDRNRGGVGAAQAGAAEADRDVGGNVVGQIGEGDDAIDRGQVGRALQGAAAGQALGRHQGTVGRAIGRAAQVAELVPSLKHRLLGKGHPGRGRGRGLRLNDQAAGGTSDFAQSAEIGGG